MKYFAYFLRIEFQVVKTWDGRTDNKGRGSELVVLWHFCLFVVGLKRPTQHDGFVVAPSQWQDVFLEFDYLGSPALWGMGNGGFSLRSKKLLTLLAKDETIVKTHPEDTAICKTYRSYLEKKGIRFASPEIAHHFSIDANVWQGQFGFHNSNIGTWNIDAFADPSKHGFYIDKFKKQYKNN